MKNKIFLIVFTIIVFISTIFPQHSFRSGVFLHHSTGNRFWDYGIYDENYTGATISSEVDSYNVAHNYTGADTVSMAESWWPPPSGHGNEWYDWDEIFHNGPDYTDVDIYPIIESNKIIFIKCGINIVIGAGSSADTSGAGVSYNTVYNIKWHIREILPIMEDYTDKFWVMMVGWPCVDDLITYDEAQWAHWINVWAKDTLAMGLDATYGDFPPNVYIFDAFHKVDDADHYLDPAYATSLTDSHPNADAANLIAPLIVQEIFDAAIAYEATIPVELTSFTASIILTGVELNWSTATELNNNIFEIQRKTSNDEFMTIGFVKGQGTSTSKTDYSFVDKNANSGKYLYRLKQIDFDGKYNYSKAVEIDFNPITNYTLEQNYPNPFNPSTEINYTLAKSGNITLKVYNNLGLEVATLADGFMNSGKHSVKFNAKDFTSGVYFYRLKADNFTSTRKMLLIK